MKSLGAKALLALAAIAIPAIAATAMLGLTLVQTVREAESDVDLAMSTARCIAEIRLMMERERGLVTRLPAELDQSKIDGYVAEITTIHDRVEAAIGGLA